MKIRRVSAHLMGIPGPGGVGARRNWIFIRVETDEGITGVGEATTEWQEAAVVAFVERDLAAVLCGQDPTRIADLWERLWRGMHWRGGVTAMSAISGIDQALWDITGKVYGQPVYKLLGGAVRERVRLYARSDLGLATHAEELSNAKSEGFTAFKFGPGEIEHPFNEVRQVAQAIEETRKLRDVAGDECDLIMDCAGLFSSQAAYNLASGVSEMRLMFLEEPVNMDIPRLLASLRHSSPGARIAAGERVVTRWGFREWLETGAVDIVQPDVCHCGGITELMRIAAFADVYHVQVAPHNPYGPVALSASLQACAAMPNFLILEHCRFRPYFDDVQKAGPTIRDGCAYLPDRPGLGVDLDWEYVERHPFRQIPYRMHFDSYGALIG